MCVGSERHLRWIPAVAKLGRLGSVTVQLTNANHNNPDYTRVIRFSQRDLTTSKATHHHNRSGPRRLKRLSPEAGNSMIFTDGFSPLTKELPML